MLFSRLTHDVPKSVLNALSSIADVIHNSLVLVSGFAAPRVEKDGDPKTFFAQKFPKSLIDEFFFLDSSVESERLLYQRSMVLLEQLRDSRGPSSVSRRFDQERGNNNTLHQVPIIFAAHGLGGFIAKQVRTSDRATRQMGWEHLYVRLLSASRLLPDHPLKLVHRLVEELEGVNASFRTISYSFNVVNFYESSQHPVVRHWLDNYEDQVKLI
ncbi:Ankyrin repeat-containing domain protein [Rutstroemia sp. NJR-2017a WRK4]|nr:Ankyrin repeat-containing domain protein [Rutstroemia sp. NJR-2017a WRK4]